MKAFECPTGQRSPTGDEHPLQQPRVDGNSYECIPVNYCIVPASHGSTPTHRVHSSCHNTSSAVATAITISVVSPNDPGDATSPQSAIELPQVVLPDALGSLTAGGPGGERTPSIATLSSVDAAGRSTTRRVSAPSVNCCNILGVQATVPQPSMSPRRP